MASLLRRIGVERPIIQAPMAGVSTAALAAAASNAGALGSIAVGALDVAGAERAIMDLRALTAGPINVNVFAHRPARSDPPRDRAWLEALAPVFQRFGAEPPQALGEIYTSVLVDEAMVELLLDTRPTVVSFHFGLPAAPVLERFRAAGVVLFATATNLEEALSIERAGIDAVVAQGVEAGGHRGVFDPAAADPQLSVAVLTRLLVKTLDVPVVAAGGIMDGAGIAAAQALGAAAAQLGTAFIACPKSGADPSHLQALKGPGSRATEMTSILSGRPARSLPNGFTALKDAELRGLTPPDYPMAYDAAKALAAAARRGGNGDFGAFWAGQGAPLARALPAAELVALLLEEMPGGGPAP